MATTKEIPKGPTISDIIEGEDYVALPPELAKPTPFGIYPKSVQSSSTTPGRRLRPNYNAEPITPSNIILPTSARFTDNPSQPVNYTPPHPSLMPAPRRRSSRFMQPLANGSSSSISPTTTTATASSTTNANNNLNAHQAYQQQQRSTTLPADSQLLNLQQHNLMQTRFSHPTVGCPQKDQQPQNNMRQPPILKQPTLTRIPNQSNFNPNPVPNLSGTNLDMALASLAAGSLPVNASAIDFARALSQQQFPYSVNNGQTTQGYDTSWLSQLMNPMAGASRDPINIAAIQNIIQATQTGMRPTTTSKPTNSKQNIQRMEFTPQAKQVRPAFEDFVRLAQDAVPGLRAHDVHEILRKLQENPSQPVQLKVPEGSNSAVIQEKLQSLLEKGIMTSMFTPHQQTVRPPPPNATRPAYPASGWGPAPNSWGNPSLRFPAPGQFSKQFNNQQQPSGWNLPPQGAPMPPNTQPQQQVPPPPPPPTEDDMAIQDQEADVDHDEDFQEIETFSDYMPQKLKIGVPHPDPVVETSSLSTVEPPKVTYGLKLPAKVMEKGLLSALQLESVIYACQQHEQMLPDGKNRRGFLIGDGAGVGKGRTIAGIIFENYLSGRKKAIWLSVSTDLKLDAERDLKDIGCKVPVYLLGKFVYGKKINISEGIIFTTYSGLVSKSQTTKGALGSRIGQLTSWVGANFDGCIVFDECHKAKNIAVANKSKTQSKAAQFVQQLQDKLPKARIVYASATGASETKHLGYMSRLGIWGPCTPYPTFAEFCASIEKRGVGAMELVAVELKSRGAYVARQLSFKTSSFEIRVAPLDEVFVNLYDSCVEMWQKTFEYFQQAATFFSKDKRMSRHIWATFWAAHQKFFKYLCIGAKVPMVVEVAKQALIDGKCVVIGLQSTGEAKTVEALEDGDINEFISTARATYESLIENHFPGPRNHGRRRANIVPKVSPSTSRSNTASPVQASHSRDNNGEGNGYKRELTKNEKVLKEIAEQKRKLKKQQTSSSRTQRAKKRQASKRKTRVRMLESDSDTELSNPLSSSSSPTLGSDDSSYNESSGDSSTDEEEEANSDASDLTIKRQRTSSPEKSRRNVDSDSDIEITAVKPATRQNYHVIILSSDDDGEPDEDEDDENNPAVKFKQELATMQEDMFKMIDSVGPHLPNNILDDLIDRLGGPTKVAEMTGRKGHIVKDEDGQITYKNRNDVDAMDALNVGEKNRFMSGEKLIAIISEAASSGISLQADRRVKNTRRRVHITIELPWSADRAIQQFGRTHRSNQVCGPEYMFVISDLAGEKRFASIVAKRLESLGALTHGDRRSNTEMRDLSQFNIVGRFCKEALTYLCNYVESSQPFANIKPSYDHRKFIKDAREAFVGVGLASKYGDFVNVDATQASKSNIFLNRILGMKVQVQNALFKLFTDYMDRLIMRRKVNGSFDAGILELNSDTGKARCDKPIDYYLKTASGSVLCTLRDVLVERGISWNDASQLLASAPHKDSRSGFYLTVNPLTKAVTVMLLIREPEYADSFRIYKPNTGRAPKPEPYYTLVERAKKVEPAAAEPHWKKMYEFTDTKCIHLCLFQSCKRIEAKRRCDVGLRHRKYCILSGAVLNAWPYLEKKAPNITSKLQIVRLKLDAKNRVIGPIIPQDYVDEVRRLLKLGEEKGVDF